MASNDNTGFRVPYTVRDTPDKGRGIFANAPIRKGTILWRHIRRQYTVYDERSLEEFLAKLSRSDVVYELTHMFDLFEFPGYMIRVFDDGVLINHSRQPTVAVNNDLTVRDRRSTGDSREKSEMADQIAETIWALEEACEAAFCAGDHEKSISFFHDQFLGWPEPARPLMDRSDLLRWNKKDAAELGAYTFKIERSGIRIVGNTATTNLTYHFAGTNRDGVEYEETHRWAHTWIKDDSEWKILTGTTYQIG